MAVQSYIGLVNYIENFAQNHLQIRRFKAEFDEQLPNFATETEAYPILFMSPSSNVYAQNDDKFIVKFYCFDVIQKDRSNINTIYSDCSLILNDLKKFIQDGDNYLFNVDSIESTAIPINNALLDYVAGVQMELVIQVDTYSYCEIPLDAGILVPTEGVDVVYSQYLTCETVTGCTTLQDYITSEIQSQSTTTWSGGTVVGDSSFLGNVTINGDTIVNNITGNTASFTNYNSGGTSLEQVILNLTGGIEDITRVQDGINTYTGGTPNAPTINIVDSPSFNSITFSGAALGDLIGANLGLFVDLNSVGISGQTFYSGGTPLEDVILSIAGGEEDITRVQPGSNIITGGTANAPTVSLTANPSVNNLTFSGTAIGGNVQAGAGTFTSLSATTISGDGSGLTSIIVPEQVFDWTFSNSITNSDPGAKFFKFDNSSLNLVSKIYISYSATNLTNLSSIVKNLEAGDRIYLQQKNNQKNGALYYVSASTIDNGTWMTIPVSWISSAENNDFNNNKEGVFTFVKKNARLAEGISTGLISGGTLSANIDPTKFNISAGLGYIVDYTVYPQQTKLVSWPSQSGLTLTNLTTKPSTDIAININGNILQQDFYTRSELRSVIFLGGFEHSNLTNIINTFQLSVPTYGVGSSLKDLSSALGDINLDGNVFTSNGANLKLDKSAGSTFAYGRGYKSSPNDPNFITQSATTQQVFTYAYNNGSGIAAFSAVTTDVDANLYDNGSGILQSVPNNKYTIQRILMFSNTQRVFIQYGANVYNTLDEAKINISTASFKNLVGLNSAIVRGYLILKKGVTNLQSATDALLVNGDKFGGIGGSIGVASNNYYTTGATISGTAISFNRNDLANAYSVNLSALTGNVQVAGNLSATTFFSGSTPLSTVISNLASGDVTRVQNGLNTYTGGTNNAPTVNISAATLDHLVVSGTSVLNKITGTTIAMLNSGATNSIFVDYSGNLINTGVTNSAIIAGSGNTINANLRNVLVSGIGLTANVSDRSYFTYVKSSTVSGDILLSGSTNLYSIFSTTDTNDITRVQPGANITTGGTVNAPTINLIASPSVNNLTFSGTATGGNIQAAAGTFTSLSATTLSGGTILSGGTNLYSIFAKTTDIPTVPSLYAYDFMAAVSDELTAITTGNTKLTFYAPRTFTLTGITASLVTTGSTTTTIDVNYNGASVFATPVSLASGVFYATTATTTTAISKYGKFTVDFDAAGTGAKGVKITLEGRTIA